MPIRFRCPGCDQLLGIARRKAGTMVRCPSCRQELPVPTEDEAPPAQPMPSPPPLESAPALPKPSPEPALFERDDFEDLLNQSVGPSERRRAGAVRAPAFAGLGMPSAPASTSTPVQESAPWADAVEPVPSGSLTLTPKQATVLTVVVIFLLAIAFALGLIVGRFLL